MNRVCDNCETILHGEYCHHCGQDNRTHIRGLGSILHDFFQEFGSWDSRLVRTLVPLMFRPAFLSNEFVRGRRARYVPPLRLYLFISIVFFLVIAVVGNVDSDAIRMGLTDTTAPAEQADESGGLQVGASVAGRPLSERMNLSLPFLDEEGEAEFRRRLDRLAENPELFFRQVRALAPTMMFLMLPVFAFVLKVFYIYKRRYYIEHLVIALHNHAFLFLSFLSMIGMGQLSGFLSDKPLAPIGTGVIAWLLVALWVWLPVYLFIAQKRFYMQGWFLTTIKFFMTGVTYFTMLALFALGLMIASVMTA